MNMRMRNRRSGPILGAAAIIVGLGACLGDSEFIGPEPIPIEDTEFAPELGVNLKEMTRTDEGLYLQDIEVGEGEKVVAGDSIAVYYTGWLSDGKEFDGTEEGTPVHFVIGMDRLIAGWELGVPGMREGGKRRLVIPYYLGYGSMHYGPIPAYSTLVFDIEVVEIFREDPEEEDPDDEDPEG